ncbi:head processing protein [Rosenbergiella collisarenosi]|uniref:head processing protein n=1 Tax=Rosenbergiella collisarenosi TaxID=1544695 RepID=UPI001F4E1E3A|nr:head processing protein [Rosenbergiella collisarenosi]
MRTVTDRFSLIDKIRKHTPQNGRKYLLESVGATFNDPTIKERIALGEMFGYFGHGRRAMSYERTGSLDLPETAIIMVDGKPVIIDNVPSNRTLDISLDDNGVVTHTQEILDTPTGQIVDGMEKAKAGGWSWATGGDDQPLRSFVSSYHGMDYVNNPNYISLDKQGMMFESADVREKTVISKLQASGFSEAAAIDIAAHFEKLNAIEPITLSERNAMLESALALEETRHKRLLQEQSSTRKQLDEINRTKEKRKHLMIEAVSQMPIFLTKAQKQALVSMETEDDMRIVMALLESASQNAVRSLPIGERKLPDQAKTSALGKKDEISFPFILRQQ